MFRWLLIFSLLVLFSCEKSKPIILKSPIEYNFNLIKNCIAVKKRNYEIIDTPFIKKIESDFLYENEKPIFEVKFSINNDLFYILYILSYNGDFQTSSVCLSARDLSTPQFPWNSFTDGNNVTYYNTTSESGISNDSFYLVSISEKYFFKNIKQIKSGDILKINTKYKINGIVKNEEKIITKENYELKDLKIGEYSSNVVTSYFYLPIDIEKIKNNLDNNLATCKNLISIDINRSQFNIPIKYVKEIKTSNDDLYDKQIDCIDLEQPINDKSFSFDDFRVFPVKDKILIFFSHHSYPAYCLYNAKEFSCQYTHDGIKLEVLSFKQKKR